MSSGDLYHAESYLDFKNLHLCGREKDIQVLNKAYEQSSFNSSPQIVWLKGNPGVGKSALVEHLFLPKDNYCSGKFDRLRTSVPYSALTQLLTKLAYVLEFDDKVISSLSEDDESILSHLVPEISVVLKKKIFRGNTDNPQDSAAAAAAASVSCNLEWGLERLKQALRAFLMAVCNTLESPLIMFLDDLQWADLDTLEILKDLLVAEEEDNTEQHKGSGFLFIGAYRDNEVEEDSHPLARCIRSITDGIKRGTDSCMSEMSIMNLDETETNELVAELTDRKPEDVLELSKLIYSKTDGNCFYTLHALRHIHEKNLLYMSRMTLRWEWDAENIREEVQVSDNVAEFMTRKLKKLPQSTLDALTLSAFLGHKVDAGLLEALFPLMNPDAPPLLKLLQPAVEANLIEMHRDVLNSSRKVVRFTHDRVATAAYDMIPEGTSCQSLHLKIGRYLRNLVLLDMSSNRNVMTGGGCETSTAATNDSTQWQLILAVDQLNRGSDLIDDAQEQVLVARLNLVAAQQVLQTGAFKLATGFLESGLELVGFLRWKMSYDLTLELSVTLASVLYSNGCMEVCLALLNEIFANAVCPRDKYEAHSIQLDVLESMGESDMCLAIGIATLTELGHPKIPRRPHLGHVVIGAISAKKALKRMSDEDILALPECRDPANEFIMRHLNCLSAIGYYSFQEELMVVTGYRVLQMSLKSGVTRYSPSAFCIHAFSLAAMGDLGGAFRFAQISVKLTERFPTDYRTSCLAYCLLYHLRKPIHECINNTLRVYNSAFSKGDLKSAGLACTMHCATRYCAGLPLDLIAKDAFGFCHQLKKYQQTLNLKYLLFSLRGILELMGRSDELSHFLENAQDDKEFESYMKRDGDTNGLNNWWLRTMNIRYRLGDLDSAIEFGEKNWRTKGPSGFFVFSVDDLLFSALVALQAWKRTRTRRYWRLFRKCHKELGTWVKSGNLNSRHTVFLLDAELAVVKKRQPDKIRSMFEASISLASRTGFVQHAALASEQAGQYFLEQKDSYWTEHYLTNAHELYTDWTATAKVKQMEAKYKSLIVSEEQKSTSLSFDNGAPSRRRRSNVSVTGRSRLELVAQVEAKREGISARRVLGPAA